MTPNIICTVLPQKKIFLKNITNYNNFLLSFSQHAQNSTRRIVNATCRRINIGEIISAVVRIVWIIFSNQLQI